MKQQKNGTLHFVVCIDNSGYPASLELYKIYCALPDRDAAKDGDVRIIDESGEDYLYSAARFIQIKLPQALKRTMSMTVLHSGTTRARSRQTNAAGGRTRSAIRKSAPRTAM